MATVINTRKRKGGRPRKRKNELRSHHVKVGFNDLEFDTVKYKAQQAGRNVADFIREASLNVKVRAHINEEQLEMVRDVARMGNNLNQLAKQANIAGFNYVRHQCEGMVVELAILVERIGRGGDLSR